jgi:putative membrane protein
MAIRHERAEPHAPGLEGRSAEETSFQLSSRRTRLSFQRTRMSADRTLMSIIRTALSLIGFGFTIFQFFRFLRQSTDVAVNVFAARNFGMALVSIGILLLILGTIAHIRFMLELRTEHADFVSSRMIPNDRFPYSGTLAVALLVLLLGLFAIVSIVGHVGPFS